MIYVHLAEGFEEIEAVTVIDLLRRAEIPVKSVSIEGSEVTGTHNITVKADLTIDEADYDLCEMIVLPGGIPGTPNLEKCRILSDKIDEFYNKGKYLAAICAAPMILGHKGYLDNRKAVIYDGLESELGNASVSDEKAVKDGNIITGKGPGCAIEFALEIISVIKDKKTADKVRKSLLY